MVQSDETVTITDTTKLLEDVASLYLSQKFSDITLLVDDQKLYAHKVILAMRSEYFESLLYEDPQNTNQTEITITGVTFDALRSLLKYIYTGTIAVSSDVESSLEIVGLAHQYSFTDIQTTIIKKLKPLLNLKNVCAVLNTANLYELEELLEACHSFMDLNASEVVTSDCFTDLSQKSMIILLQRNNFVAPEIEIFKNVAKWCNVHNDVDDLVKQCVRLSSMTVVDIVSTVWPSKLFDCEKLLQAIAEIVGVKAKTSTSRGFYLLDENLATAQHNAEVILGTNTAWLLTGGGKVESKFAYHIIDGKSGIIVKLGAPSFVNHIKLRLWDGDTRSYSYNISVSLDQKNWRTIIDYSRISCRSDQVLFFNQQVMQYIKIVGTQNTINSEFHIISFEAYFKNNVPSTTNGIICPNYNVATLDKKALVIKGENPSVLLNGNVHDYDGSRGYSWHSISSGNLTIQLAQPYIISTMRLLLWDRDSRRYRYFVETSIDNSDWEIAVDLRNQDCTSWQNLRFKERVVVFIRITGTLNTANTEFHVVHFECPSAV
ncbi:BTB/POZ domain-containing protein 9-like [Zophobas morio]|uniref:BTB/POZ domain-containing protein 9-like n=1 Tax=Zophobas morio TaxID=2755281 RepID=UPI003082F634